MVSERKEIRSKINQILVQSLKTMERKYPISTFLNVKSYFRKVFDKKMSHNLRSQWGQSENGVAVEFLLLVVFTMYFLSSK